MYYDGQRMLSYNALFNLIVGNRGCGKTYFAKNKGIKDFINKGSQFIYLRRYETEIKANKLKKFFSDIKNKYPDHKLSVEPGGLFTIDDKEAGYALALSRGKIDRSIPYPEIGLIIFDEFILDKNAGYHKYLPDEVMHFLDLYETIARLRDNVIVLFLSNAISQTNPYFTFFNVELPRNGNTIWRRGDLLVEIINNQEFIDYKKKTRFAQLIKDTRYAEYAIDNKFLRDTQTFIERKEETAKYYFTLNYKSQTLGIWYDYKKSLMYVSNNVDPFCRVSYTLTLEDHTTNTLMIKRMSQGVYFKNFIDHFKHALVRFESMNIKNVTFEILSNFMA